MKIPTAILVSLTVASLAGGGAGSARADWLFTADLDGPTAGTDSPATGEASLVMNEAQTEVAYVVTYANLVGEPTAAHFHVGQPGEFGTPVFELAVGSPMTGIWPLTPDLADHLFGDRVSVFVHSDAYPFGEIRGNISLSGVSAAATTWGGVKALFD